MIFPVIAYKKKGEKIYVFHEEDKLKTTNEDLLYRDKVFDGIEFIDSAGNIFRILSIKKVRWGTPLLGYSLFRKGRLIKIDFDLQITGRIDIEDFRNLVLQSLEKNHPFMDEIRKDIQLCKSYPEIINKVK